MAKHAMAVMASGNELSALENHGGTIRDLLVERLVRYSLELTRGGVEQSLACAANDTDHWDHAQKAIDAANIELLVIRLALFQLEEQGGQQ